MNLTVSEAYDFFIEYDNIKNIRAITFNFKDVEITDSDGKKTTIKDDKSRIGFIAQDWETKYSQLVNTDDDGVKSFNSKALSVELYTKPAPSVTVLKSKLPPCVLSSLETISIADSAP